MAHHHTVARQLATQMTAAGLTPGNIHESPAYMAGRGGGQDMLAYAETDRQQWTLGERACSLHRDRDNHDSWLCFDQWGAEYATISHDGTAWVVS